MQMPPIEPDVPTLPDETNPGTVPPMGPRPVPGEADDVPLPGDDPGENPDLPPAQKPFPDGSEIPDAVPPRSL